MTMHRVFLSACLAVLAMAPVAKAQECDRNDDSQQMMTICAGADLATADAKLNTTYQSVLGEADDKGKTLLKTAQRAWVAFRDAECAYSTQASEGGSIHPMEVSQCLTKLTETRTKQLTTATTCSDGDVNCTSPGEDASDGQ